MKSKLIVFRGLLSTKSQFGVGKPIEFSDGSKGIIRSIIDIQCQPNGEVYVYGKYKETEPEPKPKCYMCRERESVGSYLGQPFCKECVQSIEIN